MNLTEFLIDLSTIPWFQSVGNPLNDPTVHRIAAWEEWPGPSSKATERLHLRQQAFHDELRAGSTSPEQFDRIWGAVQEYVLQLARNALSNTLEDDAWDPISTAGWHAAWTAALVAVYEFAGISLPAEIQDQWQWFRNGRWPCGYMRLDDDEIPTGIIIY